MRGEFSALSCVFVCVFVCLCVGPLFLKKINNCARAASNLVFWGPISFQFDLEMNINICCMHCIIREDYWRP